MRRQPIQTGFVPIPVLIALAVAMLLGGVLGFQLGDGTFFSFGIGFGLTWIAASIVIKYLDSMIKLLKPLINIIKK